MAGKGSKLVFLSFLFFLPALRGAAQRFDAGLTVGAIASQVSGDKLAGYAKPGFEAGGLVSLALSEKFDLSFQMMYIQKGSRKNTNLEAGDPTYYRLRLAYVEVPVLLRYGLSARFRVEAGTGIAYLLSSHEEDEKGDITGVFERKEFAKYEWTMMAALDYLLSDNVFLVLGAEHSVLPVRGYEDGAIRLDRDQYNDLIRFSIRYLFKPAATQ